MARDLASLASGLLFGVGLAVSQMMNPAKVLGFLDVAGAWDPSLALVMIGALAITLPAFRQVLKEPAPRLAANFLVPGAGAIDARLVGGAAIFGVGWGLVGFCPGPALAALSVGDGRVLIFVVAMLAGMAAYSLSNRNRASGTPQAA